MTNEIKTPTTNEVVTLPTTTKAEYEALIQQKKQLDAKVSEYTKRYKAEHGIKGRTIIKEIIDLHKQGKTNKEIVELGYNKGTVMRQVMLFVKGKKQEKTTIKQYLPSKVVK